MNKHNKHNDLSQSDLDFGYTSNACCIRRGGNLPYQCIVFGSVIFGQDLDVDQHCIVSMVVVTLANQNTRTCFVMPIQHEPTNGKVD